MLKIENITKTYNTTIACKNISLEIKTGEFFVLLGPSGCGKTTILRLIAGLEKPDNGSILYKGRNLHDMEPQQRNIAMVFQNYALYPNMTVRKNLQFPLKMKKVDKPAIKDRVDSIARLLQIENLLNKKAARLSGGQQQRVAVGRALVRKPEIFLLDEPLSNLDAKLRYHLRVELARIHKELKITTIYVTHDQDEAMALADRIALIRDGEIQQVGRPEELYDNPSNIFTAKFIGFPEINHFNLKRTGSTVSFFGKTVTLPEPAELPSDITAAIRPEDIILLDTAEHGLDTSIELKQIYGPDIILHLRYLDSLIRARTLKEKSRLLSGLRKISIDFNMEKLLLFNPDNGQLIDKRIP